MITEVNGYPIIAGQFDFTGRDGIVVCDRGEAYTHDRYVVWRVYEQEDRVTAYSGYYTQDKDAALHNMLTRS